MKQRSGMIVAVGLTALAVFVMLAITGLAVFLILFVGSLGNVDCQGCHDLSGVYLAAKVAGGIGILLSSILAWGVFQTMRPRKTKARG